MSCTAAGEARKLAPRPFYTFLGNSPARKSSDPSLMVCGERTRPAISESNAEADHRRTVRVIRSDLKFEQIKATWGNALTHGLLENMFISNSRKVFHNPLMLMQRSWRLVHSVREVRRLSECFWAISTGSVG